MRNLLILFFVLINSQIAFSQEFEMILDTNYKNCYVGQVVEFELTIKPINNFNSTVILKTDILDNSISFSENYLNSPYKKSKLIMNTKGYYEGIKVITVVALSGKLSSQSLCTLNISKNIQWTKIRLPYWEGVENKHVGFLLDNKQNITLTAIGNGFIFSKFINGAWENSNVYTNVHYSDRSYSVAFHSDSIWFSSDEGLVLAHNDKIEIYNNKNCSIEEGEVWYAFVDKLGNPFVIREFANNGLGGFYHLRLSYFHDNKWDNLDTALFGMYAGRITQNYLLAFSQVAIDANNNIWFINKNNTLFNIKIVNGELEINEKNILNIPNYKYTELILDKDSILWLLDSEKNAFVYYENDSLYTINYPSEFGKIYSKAINNKNDFWFATEIGLVHFINSAFVVYKKEDIPTLNYSPTSELKIDKHNNLWIRNYDEILVFNPYGLVEMPIISSIENEEATNNAFIFPNPSSDLISVDLVDLTNADLEIYDILGNKIMFIPSYTNKSEINISSLSIGTYTILIKTNNGSFNQKLIVNK